jgi:hypothetical protein
VFNSDLLLALSRPSYSCTLSLAFSLCHSDFLI